MAAYTAGKGVCNLHITSRQSSQYIIYIYNMLPNFLDFKIITVIYDVAKREIS